MKENNRYILVLWPESQDFMEHASAVFINDERFGSSAYFVPERLYKAVKKEQK